MYKIYQLTQSVRYISFTLSVFFCTTLLSMNVSAKSEPPPKRPTKHAKVTVDHSSPSAVTEAVFAAARTNNASALSGLCDPKGENDGDTRKICILTTKHRKWKEFVRYFAKAKLRGKTMIKKNRAKVPFFFGPNGKRKEEMNLIRRGENWYLMSF